MTSTNGSTSLLSQLPQEVRKLVEYTLKHAKIAKNLAIVVERYRNKELEYVLLDLKKEESRVVTRKELDDAKLASKTELSNLQTRKGLPPQEYQEMHEGALAIGMREEWEALHLFKHYNRATQKRAQVEDNGSDVTPPIVSNGGAPPQHDDLSRKRKDMGGVPQPFMPNKRDSRTYGIPKTQQNMPPPQPLVQPQTRVSASMTHQRRSLPVSNTNPAGLPPSIPKRSVTTSGASSRDPRVSSRDPRLQHASNVVTYQRTPSTAQVAPAQPFPVAGTNAAPSIHAAPAAPRVTPAATKSTTSCTFWRSDDPTSCVRGDACPFLHEGAEKYIAQRTESVVPREEPKAAYAYDYDSLPW